MHAADGGKGIARRAAELCGGALETSNRIRNEFSVESIYRYNETNQSKEIDRFKILQNALRIDWYPTFVKLYSTGEYEIVRKVQLDKLEENIATSNKAVLEQ